MLSPFVLAVALGAASVPALPAAEPPPLAVIANEGIPVDTLTLAELLLYAAVAGAGLTAGDRLQFPGVRVLALADLMMDFALWAQAVLGLGLVAYLLALLLA